VIFRENMLYNSDTLSRDVNKFLPSPTFLHRLGEI
jgi:hypothetical protein